MKFDVKKFWDDEAENHKEFAYMYKENKNARYPFYEVRLERLIELMSNLPKGRCLDAGCGMAKAMLPFLDNGWKTNGVDSSAKMIDFAKENLIEKNYDPNIVSVGAVEDLSMFPDEHFDVVFSMGVIEYLTEEQELNFFKETKRVLKKNGIFIPEYINLIFDIATFNRFTVNFYKENILNRFFDDKKNVDEITEKIKKLVTMPEKPDKKGKYSTTRDQVYTRGENPLTFKETVKKRGFSQEDLVFYRFHVAPPLLFEENPELEKLSYKFEKEYCRDWIGYFTASGFMPVLKKI